MASHDEKSGLMGQIRRISRRLSGTILDAKAGQNLLGHRAKNPIYQHDANGDLRISGVKAVDIVTRHGSPVYVYDANRIIDNYYDYLGSLRNLNNFLLCYPVKVRLVLNFS